jgi:hypothetical protein
LARLPRPAQGRSQQAPKRHQRPCQLPRLTLLAQLHSRLEPRLLPAHAPLRRSPQVYLERFPLGRRQPAPR